MLKMIRNFVFIFILSSLSLACGRNTQISGIIAEAQFDTVACQPKAKIINIRNQNTSEPQRVRSIYYEKGTNAFGANAEQYFKIEKAVIGNNEFLAAKPDKKDDDPNEIEDEDMIIPAGGIMSIYTSYEPKAITQGDEGNVSYLDVFLNGLQLGTIQVRMVGKAETALPGCGSGPVGTPHNFNVTQITITIRNNSLVDSNGVIELPGETTQPFSFVENSGEATLTKNGFPDITITGSNIPGGHTSVDLDSEVMGTSDGSQLEFSSVTLIVGGQIRVQGKLTTESVSATNTQAPEGIQLTGSRLSGGNMTLVFAGKLDSDLLQSLSGGVVGAKIELTEQ
jgi:hypothetical protein